MEPLRDTLREAPVLSLMSVVGILVIIVSYMLLLVDEAKISSILSIGSSLRPILRMQVHCPDFPAPEHGLSLPSLL